MLPTSSGGEVNRVSKQIKANVDEATLRVEGKSSDLADLLYVFTLRSEDGTNTFLRNVGKVLRVCTETYARR